MLQIREVSKAFGEHQVLNKISFSVGEGEIYGLIGKNGAGKTTLMNIISGIMSADSGVCLLGDKKLHGGTVGYLPDIPSFFDYLTTREYLNFLLIDSNEKKERCNDLLTLVQLNGTEKINTMSRGMKQRLGIASALVKNPQILLLDEPTSALDPAGRHELMEILNNLKIEGHTIILSTHILADMEVACNRVGFINAGAIVKECDIRDVTNGRSDLWQISFATPLTITPDDEKKFDAKKISDSTYTFSVERQKEFLHYLESVPAQIVTIKNKVITLDGMFEEVCK